MPESADRLLERSRAARREGRTDEARQLAGEAADRARQDQDRSELGAAIAALGQLERDAGRTEQALELYAEAAAIARREDDALRLAHRLRHLGDIHQEAGSPDRARHCYDEALGLYRQHPDPPVLDLANLLRPMAMLEETRGNEARAAEFWAEAGRLYVEAGVEVGAKNCAQRLARLIGR